MTILYYLSIVGILACYVMVLMKLFPAEGTLKGILAIVCGLYAYVWGWMNSTRFNLKMVMIVWTVLWLICFATGGMSAFSAYSQATSGL